jgi:hypothetical protein
MNKKSSNSIAPRRVDAVSQKISNELIVYDTKRHRGHCLNQIAATVWMACDGKATAAVIARRLQAKLKCGIDERVVRLALQKLKKAGLLMEGTFTPDKSGTFSRRDALRKLGLAGSIALPIITSLVVPTPAKALSCFPLAHACAHNADCCSGHCGVLGIGLVCLP